jgi:hypothetical protein
MSRRRSKKPCTLIGQSIAPDPLVGSGNPPHRRQACTTAHPTRAHHRMVTLAKSSPSRSTPRPSQKESATVMLIDRNTYSFWHFAEPYSFSPSRINNILALYVVFIWLFLMVRTLWKARQFLPIPLPSISSPQAHVTIITIFVLTIVAAVLLFWKGRSNRRLTPHTSIEVWMRTYHLPTHPPSTPQ